MYFSFILLDCAFCEILLKIKCLNIQLQFSIKLNIDWKLIYKSEFQGLFIHIKTVTVTVSVIKIVAFAYSTWFVLKLPKALLKILN